MLFKLMLKMDDSNFLKSMDANSPEEYNYIITRGLGNELWNNLIKRSNYYAAVKSGYDPFNLDNILRKEKRLSSKFTFHKYLYIYSHIPIERLYKFICDLFNLDY
jgi:hypothetical protein